MGRVQRKVLPSPDLVNELVRRFILKAPAEELESFMGVMFRLELGYWYYEDVCAEINSSLKSLSLREFLRIAFRTCPMLKPFLEHVDEMYEKFLWHKARMPVAGAIILNESHEKCFLVKGWKPNSSWSFPRGKKNKNEEDHACAIREVKEETGFDISKLLNMDDFVEVVAHNNQRVRLYIITGVREDTAFAPLTQKEISKISWFRIDDLISLGDETDCRWTNMIKLYMVKPFLDQLKRYAYAHCPKVPSRCEVMHKPSSKCQVPTLSRADASANWRIKG